MIEQKNREHEITLNLLSELEQDSGISQRQLAKRIGIALGATNAHVNQLIKEGLIKKISVDKRSGNYEVTPKGMIKKSRLCSSSLSKSLQDFQIAKQDLEKEFLKMGKNGVTSVYIWGKGGLSELSELIALQYERNIKCLGVVQDKAEILDKQASILFVELHQSLRSYHDLKEVVENSRIFVPSVLENILIFKGKDFVAK